MAERLPLTDELAALLNHALNLSKFFPKLTKSDLEEALKESALYLYPKSAKVLVQGQEGKDLFVIHKGSASVYRDDGGTSRKVATLKPGALFGEVGLMRDGLRTATVITDETSSIFKLAYDDIAYHLKRTPDFGAHLASLADQRIQR